ncbi:hypothetical protein OH76DRAFT_263338 [Lentinus brumalis]|uniref:Uncharacterized protein n=1 Tax=Lentinus brumalis TaxID=2498619 RepID=A0A371DGL9_9APHY|nr:hypothetical protein OH76DRAFT_263338 [Polyporus brumalis]
MAVFSWRSIRISARDASGTGKHAFSTAPMLQARCATCATPSRTTTESAGPSQRLTTRTCCASPSRWSRSSRRPAGPSRSSTRGPSRTGSRTASSPRRPLLPRFRMAFYVSCGAVASRSLPRLLLSSISSVFCLSRGPLAMFEHVHEISYRAALALRRSCSRFTTTSIPELS